MLLDGRQREAEDDSLDALAEPSSKDALPLPSAAAHGVGTSAVPALPDKLDTWVRVRSVVPMGLVGFGLSGLTAKGLDLDLWPWSFVCALLVGFGLIGLGYRLARPRTASAGPN
jgi:hypothetical protein